MYPQPVVLGPGNAFSLPVTFKPLELVDYEDCIEFTTSVSSAAFSDNLHNKYVNSVSWYR